MIQGEKKKKRGCVIVSQVGSEEEDELDTIQKKLKKSGARRDRLEWQKLRGR